jgi:hypothetical protein
LGLNAQRAAVQAYLAQGAWTLQADFTEVASGVEDAPAKPIKR